eukprot:GDKI01003335.1.p3 GENE.GDKI01003335.1~~GDKI01003335.1.p3  ORF type:complete len:124 (+),score=40.38 GDKI01003335.1:655-1026(+)
MHLQLLGVCDCLVCRSAADASAAARGVCMCIYQACCAAADASAAADGASGDEGMGGDEDIEPATPVARRDGVKVKSEEKKFTPARENPLKKSRVVNKPAAPAINLFSVHVAYTLAAGRLKWGC